MDNYCHSCGKVDHVVIVKEPHHQVIWGGARAGTVGVELYIEGEWSKCEACEEEWYTPEQMRLNDDRITAARGLTMEQRAAERNERRMRRKEQ